MTDDELTALAREIVPCGNRLNGACGAGINLDALRSALEAARVQGAEEMREAAAGILVERAAHWMRVYQAKNNRSDECGFLAGLIRELKL